MELFAAQLVSDEGPTGCVNRGCSGRAGVMLGFQCQISASPLAAPMQDAQEAKKGKKKKGKKKKGEDKAPEEESPSGASLTDTRQSSLQNGDEDADLQPDLQSEETPVTAEASSKPAQPCSQETLSTAESASVNATKGHVDSKPSTSRIAAQGTGKAADNAAVPLRQTDGHGPAATSSKQSPKLDSAKVPPSPQRNSVRGTARRAANLSPAGNAGARTEWVAVPGSQNSPEQKAEWQAAGGRKAKRSTAGKPIESAPPQLPSEPAPMRQAKLPKPAKPSKAAQPDSQASGHSRASESTPKTIAAPRSGSHDEQPVLRQPSQAAAKSKVITGKAAKAAPAEGKRVSPVKAARELSLTPEQQGKARKAEGSHSTGGASLSFADMARPAGRPSQAGGEAPSMPAGPSASSAPAQEGQPGQSPSPAIRPMPASHVSNARPRAHTANTTPRPGATVEAAPRPQPSRLDKHRPAARRPVQAANGQLVQDARAGGLNGQYMQPASSPSLSASPTGMP